ncbi:MAG: hypothetical protein C5B48_14320 [Candidatus Rokuibacteriota bacterium]|nr:MAG: hypothetical protein C5B48_14320 [Candidatus Rokubacteria bacterium]
MEACAVVSCHVERPLDIACWARFSALQESPPGGFRIAALMRPPDLEAGEDEGRWLERAREAAARGPLGHHTHFVSAKHARPPTPGPAHADRMRREAEWLRENGLAPKLFCGGGWYTDTAVARTLAELGYADCTATAFRPQYLERGALRIQLEEPTWLLLDGDLRLLELPSTHSLGMAARSGLDPGPLPEFVHVYFHDTDLLSASRRAALGLALRVLARRRRPTDLEHLTRATPAPERPFSDVASAP